MLREIERQKVYFKNERLAEGPRRTGEGKGTTDPAKLAFSLNPGV
jgi:hypothetical protein